jgi:hypothetical protein
MLRTPPVARIRRCPAASAVPANAATLTSAMRPVSWLNVGLGFWLYESRFFWVHSPEQFANTAIVAIVHTSFAVAAIGCPAVRYADAALALWLSASLLVLPRLADATLWNNLFVSITILIAAAMSRAPSESANRRFSA